MDKLIIEPEAIEKARLPTVAVTEPSSAQVDERAARVRVRDEEKVFNQHIYVLVAACLRAESRMRASAV